MEDRPAAASGWRRLFWAVFERSKNGMILVDERRVVLAVNEAMCEVIGASRDELIGTRFDRFVAPELLATLDAEWRQDWQKEDWVKERPIRRADGARVRVQFAARVGEIDGRRAAVGVITVVRPEDEQPPPPAQLGELTPREREILRFVALGQTSAEIADELVISVETVRTHVRNAMAKTGARTRAQLVAMALADRHIADGE